MNWRELCEKVSLHDLPYKIELDNWGRIIMTPTHFLHGLYQAKIVRLLAEQLPVGECVTECAIKTTKGTKVADVVWISQERLSKVINEYECPVAPEICIEVLSPANTVAEMTAKRRLYFDAGAKEVWICNERGKMNFFSQQGKLSHSVLVPRFPNSISEKSGSTTHELKTRGLVETSISPVD